MVGTGLRDAGIHSKRHQDRCRSHGTNDETPPTDTLGSVAFTTL